MPGKRPPTQQKKYVSLFGCCICAVKTARLPFVKSTRYEPALKHCLRYEGRRSGEICWCCLRKLRHKLLADSRVMQAERAATLINTAMPDDPNSLRIKHLVGIPPFWHIPGSTAGLDNTVDEPDWQTYPALKWSTAKRTRNKVGHSRKGQLREQHPWKAPWQESSYLTTIKPNQLTHSNLMDNSEESDHSIQPEGQEMQIYYGKIGRYKRTKTFNLETTTNHVDDESKSGIRAIPLVPKEPWSHKNAEDNDAEALNRMTDAVPESGASRTNQPHDPVTEKDPIGGRQLRVRRPPRMHCQETCCQTSTKQNQKKRIKSSRKSYQPKHHNRAKNYNQPKHSNRPDCKEVKNYQGKPKVERSTHKLVFNPDDFAEDEVQGSSSGFITNQTNKDEPFSGPALHSEPHLPTQAKSCGKFENDNPKIPESFEASQAQIMDFPIFEDPSHPLPSGSNQRLIIEGKNWFLDDLKANRFRYLLEPVKNKDAIPKADLPKWMMPRHTHPRYRRSRDFYTNSFLLPKKISLTCKRDIDIWSVISRKDMLSEELPPLACFPENKTEDWATRKLHMFRNDVALKQDIQSAVEIRDAQEAAAAREALQYQKAQAMKEAKVQEALCLQKVRAYQAALKGKKTDSLISNNIRTLHESTAIPVENAAKKPSMASKHGLNSLGMPWVNKEWPKSPAFLKQTTHVDDDIQEVYAQICRVVCVKQDKDYEGSGNNLKSQGTSPRRVFRGPNGKILVNNDMDEVQQLEETSYQK